MNELMLNEINLKKIDKDDYEILENAKSNINKSLLDAQQYRTSVEFEVSVLNDVVHPTPDSKYWQCHREMKMHTNGLIFGQFDIELQELENERLKNKRDKKSMIEYKKGCYVLNQMHQNMKDRVREVKQISDQMDVLKNDCIFSIDNVEEHQIYSLLFRFAREYKYSKGAMGTTAGEKRNMIGHLVTTFTRIWNDTEKRKTFLKTVPNDVVEILEEEGLIKTKKKEENNQKEK